MFAKLISSSLLLLAAASLVSAHAAFAPALGVAGAPARSDVQRPSANAQCGKANVATALTSSTAVPLAADGTFTVTATDFNAGADGSRAVKTAVVDSTATGKTFAGTVAIKTNGNANPTAVGSDQITLQMPAGTTCTGGSDGASCLVSLTTTAGFGNCVLVSSAATAGTGAAAAGAAGAAAGNATATATTAAAATTTTAAGKKNKNKGVGSAAAQAAAVAKAQRQQAKAAAKAAAAAKVAKAQN